MSLAERKRTFEIAVDEIGGARTILSCSDQNLDTVIELAKHAQAIGSDFIVVHAPVLHFLSAQDETLLAYYRAVSEQVDIGIALWSHPDSGYLMSPGIVRAGRRAAECRRHQIQRAAGDVREADAARRRQADRLDRVRGRMVRQHRRAWLAALSLLIAALRLPDRDRPPHARLHRSCLQRRRSRAPRPCATASIRCARRSSARVRPKNSTRIRNTGRSCSARPAARCGAPLLELTDAEKEATRRAFESCGLKLPSLRSSAA